ncbi:MAG: GTPase Era [Bacteroidota bacterium]|nr:GTPase Era [Bacteroidota bacterium]
MQFKAAFISVLGMPNAGKSTLINALLGDTLMITNPKAQTTRYRTKGIVSTKDYQLVLSDTPGVLTPKNLLQKGMLNEVMASLSDADLYYLVADLSEASPLSFLAHFEQSLPPEKSILVLNKMDLIDQSTLEKKIDELLDTFAAERFVPISASHQFNLETLLSHTLDLAPEHPPYYPEDEVSDRNVRFFIEEIIRNEMLTMYREEVPYGVHIQVERYLTGKNLDKVYVHIFTERESQKKIILGKGGEKIKSLGIQSRKGIENFVGKSIFLDLSVKVLPKWREKESFLKKQGFRFESK